MTVFHNDMQILADADSSVSSDMSNDLRSNWFNVRGYVGYSIQSTYTGSPNGTLKIQVTNEDPENSPNWIDLADSDIAISSAGSYMHNVEIAYYSYIRLFWTVTSGSGSLSASLVVKGA